MSATRVVFVGVGGQGNLLASNLLGQAALAAGQNAVVSEIHGMAQRGGVVESAVLIGDVTSPIVSPAEADVLVGFEPAETLRTAIKANRNTTIITSTSPLPPFTVAIGAGVYPEVDEALVSLGKQVRKLIAFDGQALAEEAGNPQSLNMVMLGALAATNTVPVPVKHIKKVIKEGTKAKLLESNLKAFDLGYKAAAAAM
ncbi:MAG: indolepyruvate oxidoreductase subunit beta [Proteobacteria bacterium]|nr:indolepyruvate oxidoreductase subunit beta [Pseudomonadota bacterium]